MTQKGIWQAVGIVTFLLFCGCEGEIGPGTTQPSPRPPVSAPVAVAGITSQQQLYEAAGTVEARVASIISSKLLGTIRQVSVREGDRVNRGDTLAIIDDREVAARLQQAEAALAEAREAEAAAVSAGEAARAGAELGRATYDRYRTLLTEQSATRQEFDEVQARFRQTKASLKQTEDMVAAARQRVRQAEAAVAAAAVANKDATVLAPYDGIVTAKPAEVGDLASPGTPLVSLEETGVYRVDIALPEQYYHAVQPDQSVMITIAALAGQPPLEGRVETIVPAADQKSRSFLVKLRLPEFPNIRSGMFARAVLPVGRENLLLIPATAMISQGALTGLYLVDSDGLARFRLIRTGRTFGKSVEVLSGLKEGDRFVVNPPPTISDGVKVEFVP
jgi:multidrug efflux pump subunit AcrA (membrane-fusion protein)